MGALAGFASAPVRADGLGPATVQSVKGEPLRVTLGLGGDDSARVPVRLASPASYARWGLTRDPALMTAILRITTEPDRRRLLRIETGEPIDAPALVLVLEQAGARRLYRLNLLLTGPEGRVQVKGSALDGPDAQTPLLLAASGSVATPEPRSGPATAPPAGARGPGVRALDPPPPERTGPQTAEDPAGPAISVPIGPQGRPDVMTVAAGADLESLAQAIRPPGATLEQAAAALLRDNRPAFAGSPPRPIVGARLQVPSEATVLAVSPAQARLVLQALQTGEMPAAQGGR